MKLDALKHPDLMQLRNEGYDLQIVGTHLLVKSVPYVTSSQEVKYDGIWVTPLHLGQGDRTEPPTDHTAYFAGERPCTAEGAPLNEFIIEEPNRELAQGLKVNFKFSFKFTDGKGGWRAYKDHHEKMLNYVRLLLHEAKIINPAARADLFPVILPDDDDSPFEYEDTSSSRAGIEALAPKLALDNIAIVGLGGTGSFVLDLIAKTHVKKIHLFDDDDFHQHTAFRSPGAVAKEDLKRDINKVGHYANVYARLRKGIVPHPYRINAENLDELDEMQFVFLCLDSGELKEPIMRKLEEKKIPFIDVGMGVLLKGDALQAILRVTTSAEGHRNHLRDNDRVSFAAADGDNIYRRNIQVADLNALNAALAVMKWKKLCGYYVDIENEYHSVYVSSVNTLSNEDN